MKALEVTELLGDGIGAELRDSVHTVAASLPVAVAFESVDLSLEARRRDAGAAYDGVLASLARTKLGLKYPTVTAEESRTPCCARGSGCR